MNAASLLVPVVLAVSADGAATSEWLDALRGLGRPADAVAAAGAERRPLTPEERAWEALVRARAAAWEKRRAELAVPFSPVKGPDGVRVVLGNRGGEDAFAPDARTVAFDLSRFVAVYGAADDPENAARVDRFLDHEYTHLLQKAWLAEHPFRPATALERAELDMWREGLGNYYSLSPKWRSAGGAPSAAARSALAELEPVLVSRLDALACASESEAGALMAGLSQGPFEKKWGALPVALWLEREASARPAALADFVKDGPAAVRLLARRSLAPELLPAFEAAYRLKRCGGAPPGGAR